MRTFSVLLAGLLVSFSHAGGAAAPSAACTTATASCTEWVTLGGGPARSLIYRTRSLDARNDGVRRALIMVHGTNRNADHYFSTAVAATFLAGAPRRLGGDLAANCVGGGQLPRHARGERSELELHRRQLALRRRVGQPSRSHVVRFHRSGAEEARQQAGVSESRRDRRRRTFGGWTVRRALPDGQPGARHARRAGHLRRRQSVQLRMARQHAAATGRRWRAGQCEGAETEKVHTKFAYGAFDASACANYKPLAGRPRIVRAATPRS